MKLTNKELNKEYVFLSWFVFSPFPMSVCCSYVSFERRDMQQCYRVLSGFVSVRIAVKHCNLLPISSAFDNWKVKELPGVSSLHSC